jgi:hypothetical protein
LLRPFDSPGRTIPIPKVARKTAPEICNRGAHSLSAPLRLFLPVYQIVYHALRELGPGSASRFVRQKQNPLN